MIMSNVWNMKKRSAIPILFCSLLTSCTKTCYLQEVNPLSQSPYNQSSAIGMQNRALGFERYQALLKSIHKNGCFGLNSEHGNKAHSFKLRFCNYMLGYRNDNKNELIAIAKELSDYYKKVRMYDQARTFDSYRDVLLFGHETIAESWDDTMLLLEQFQAEVIKRQKEEQCRIEREKKEREPSFWAKLFGSKKQDETCNCEWDDPILTPADQIAMPRVISEPPGSCNMKNPLLFKRSPKYDACFGTQTFPQCSTCPINGRTSASTIVNDNASVNAAARYLR